MWCAEECGDVWGGSKRHGVPGGRMGNSCGSAYNMSAMKCE